MRIFQNHISGYGPPPTLVIEEFARTRRNRFILTTVAAFVVLVLTILPDLEAGTIGIGSELLTAVFVLVYYLILRSRRRERQNTDSFPAVAATIREIEINSNGIPRVFGYYVVGEWFVKKSLLTLDFFPASDILWVYSKNTKHYFNFIPTGTEYSIAAALRSGKLLIDSYRAKVRDEKLTLLKTIAPRAYFGYNDELHKTWKKNKAEFWLS